MTERYTTAEEFLAEHVEITDEIEVLEAGFHIEEESAPRRPTQEWSETQRARAEYLKEWEEDMRYAQELASEGM